MPRETKVNREGSSKISRCFECEIVFQPENSEKCCSDCSKGRPFIKHTTDHIYAKNMLSFSHNQSQLVKRSIASDVGTNKIKRIRLISDDSWQKFKSSDTTKKEETVTHLMTASGAKPFLNMSSSNNAHNANIKKQIHNIPLSTKLLRLCDNPPKTRDQDVFQQRMELAKWNCGVIDSKGDTAINNFQLVPLNRNLDYTNLELTALRAEENDLEKLIVSCSSDYDEVLSIQKMRRISELEVKRGVEENILASKEEQVKSLERRASQSKSFVDARTREREFLSIIVKKSFDALELARSSASAAEKDVSEAVKKLAAAKDEDVKIHRRHSLSTKDKRAADCTKDIVVAVSELNKAEKDLQDAEDDLKTKKAAYQQVLEQAENAKSELHRSNLRDSLASIDQELTFYDSQVKSLNYDNYCKRFELKKKMLDIKRQIEKEELIRNVDIKYDRKRDELDMEKEFADRYISLEL